MARITIEVEVEQPGPGRLAADELVDQVRRLLIDGLPGCAVRVELVEEHWVATSTSR